MNWDNVIEFVCATLITGAVAFVGWGIASAITLHLCSWEFFLGTWFVIGLVAGFHYWRKPKKQASTRISDPELERALKIEEAGG